MHVRGLWDQAYGEQGALDRRDHSCSLNTHYVPRTVAVTASCCILAPSL